METKLIQLPPPKVIIKETNENTKQRTLKKEPVKRQITTTSQWKFTEADLESENQISAWKNPTPFLCQQIRKKLSSYRSQDTPKFTIEALDVSNVLQKLEEADGKCFYCRQIVWLLYDNVREPRQWTLERLDNKKGHIYDNVEIACLSCNLRRRTMKYERYVMTKQIQHVVKSREPMSPEGAERVPLRPLPSIVGNR